MDIFSIFSRSPERQIERLRKKVKEPHGDPSVRQNAAQKLFEMGTEPAIRALLDRFTINVSPSIQDEREKEDLLGWLVSLRERSVPPLIQFLKQERSVYWPARALRQILDEGEWAQRFNEILRFHWENPPATAYPKVDIIRSLKGVRQADLEETIQLFLEDDDDDVRLAAVEFLLDLPEDLAREPILECYVNSEDRPRIRSQILNLVVEQGWTVRGYRPVIEESLPEGYILTREGRIRRVGP